MTKARDIADLLDANGDVVSGALDNVPASNDASALTTGTIDNARISLDVNEIPNLDTAKITTGTFSDARMPSTVLNSNVSVPNQSAFRNIIINGDMSIDQRNNGSSVTATNGGYTIDRWVTGSSQSSKFTVDQETDAPTGFSYSVKLTSSASTTPASTDQYWFAQNIEGFNTAYLEYGNSNAKTVTVSFHVKSSLTGTFSGSLMNSSYNYSYPFTYSISSANTWEKKSVVITGATAGTWIGATNGVGIRMYFSLGNGSNFLGTAGSWSASQNNGATGETQLVGTSGATLFITGVQLEAGTTASDFEFLPYDVNENRCMRYFEEFQGANAHGGLYSGSVYIGHIQYKVRKRTRPTLSNVNGSGYTSINNSSGGDKGGEDNMYFNAGANAYIINISIDAEL